MVDFTYSDNSDSKTREIEDMLLQTLYESHVHGSDEVDLGILKEKAKSGLSYFADAVSILREKVFIGAPPEDTFRISSEGISEYRRRNLS
jgi:hypothetical protein